MKLLFDTHVLLWIVGDESQLSATAKSVYLNPENDLYLSSASVWEMAIKISLERLKIPATLEEFVATHVRGNGIKILPIALDHLYRIEHLPFHHRDPFDRLLIAQAICENYPIVSADSSFDAYPVTRVW